MKGATRAERVFLRLLAIYPGDFRREAQGELLEMFREALQASRGRGGLVERTRFWVFTFLDIACSAIPERVSRVALRPRRTNTSTGGAGTVETLVQDVRYAFRGLRRARGFTAVAALTTALGIGATATIFSVANAVMLRTLTGVRSPDQMVTVHATSSDGSSFHSFSVPNYLDLRDGDNGLSELAAYSVMTTSLSGGQDADVTVGYLVSANYFETIGATPEIGRFFRLEEDRAPGTAAVAVLSHRSWSRRFGSDPGIVGRTVVLNGHPFTIVGVAERGFSGHLAIVDIEVFAPLSAQPFLEGPSDRFDNRNFDWLELVGRRTDGVSLEQTTATLVSLGERLESTYASANRGQGVDVRPYSNLMAQQAGPVRQFFTLLFVVAGMILLVSAVNVAGMLLARASDRQGEMAVRLALGAGRTRLVRQMITESVVLFLLGGLGGIALTYIATGALSALQLPIPIPLIFDFAPDQRVLLFSLAVALATGIGFGLAPAFQATGRQLASRMNRGRGVGSGGKLKLRETFVVIQVAGSALLLIGAGLFVRALGQAGSIDLGFDPEAVHMVGVDLGTQQYSDAEGVVFYDRFVEQVRALPGVEAVGLVHMPPLAFGNSTTTISVPGTTGERSDGRYPTDVNRVTSGYFAALRIGIVEGAVFEETATNGVVINETLAERIWPGESAIGRGIRLGSSPDAAQVHVVAVVRDGKYRSLSDGSRAMLYLPFSGFYNAGMSVLVRGGDAALPTTFRDIVREMDPDLPLMANAPYQEIIGLSFLPNRIAAIAASSFGLLGLLLSAIGLYGILAYTVSRRTRELGIRLALGAQRSSLRRLVLIGGVRLTAIGLGLGFAMAFGLTRFLGGLLHGISPADPLTFFAIGALLCGTALVACLIPAGRATRTDPLEALHHD